MMNDNFFVCVCQACDAFEDGTCPDCGGEMRHKMTLDTWNPDNSFVGHYLRCENCELTCIPDVAISSDVVEEWKENDNADRTIGESAP